MLQEYLVAWAHKLLSLARSRRVTLWYVDCFAGPWQARDERLSDTSIAIGLDAIAEAAQTWAKQSFPVEVGAIFVEPNVDAYGRLTAYLKRRSDHIRTVPIHGEFGNALGEIQQLIGQDPAFVFVDPTGWKGAAMRYIAPLMGERRDVMVNVMFNHVNRFKDDPREFLRDQMRSFFGLETSDVPPQLDEEQLIALYRAQLKSRCGLRYAADLAVPHPVHDRTWFRLVVGGNASIVLDLFRTVERKVVGDEAGAVRDDAARRAREKRAPQLELSVPAATDRRYDDLRAKGMAALEGMIVRMVAERSCKFRELWPLVLEELHVTKTDVKKKVFELHRQRRVAIVGLGPRERSANEDHLIRLLAGPEG